MLEYREITLADREWMNSLLKMSNYRSEEYSFTFTYIWKNVFAYKAARMGDFLLIKSERGTHPPSFLFPAGSGDVGAVIEELLKSAHCREHGLLFHTVLEEQVKLLETMYPGKFHFMPLTDYFDYVYEAKSLITLSGKKLHSKRNHINRFKQENPDWTYEPITPSNLHEVVLMNEEWLKVHLEGETSKSLIEESRSVSIAIHDFMALGLDGGIIRASGKIIAFSMGDRLNSETYLVHIEKAFGDIQGAYAMINQQFAEHNCQDYLYINREDDSGQEGLRKAKRSYNPAFLVEKYAAKWID